MCGNWLCRSLLGLVTERQASWGQGTWGMKQGWWVISELWLGSLSGRVAADTPAQLFLSPERIRGEYPSHCGTSDEMARPVSDGHCGPSAPTSSPFSLLPSPHLPGLHSPSDVISPPHLGELSKYTCTLLRITWEAFVHETSSLVPSGPLKVPEADKGFLVLKAAGGRAQKSLRRIFSSNKPAASPGRVKL